MLALLLLVLAALGHAAAVYSITSQELGTHPDTAPVRYLFNDGAHRVGPAADFLALYGAGVLARRGWGAYGAIPSDAEVPYAFPYRYAPPVASTLGAALSCLSPHTAWLLWAALTEVVLFACLAAWWVRSTGFARWFGACALLASTPFILELHMGQFTFAATACAFIGLLFAGERRWLPSIALACGAFLKTFPLVSVPALLRRRAWDSVVVFGVFALVLGIDALARPSEWQTFLDLNFSATHLATSDAGNFGFLHTVAQWGRAAHSAHFSPAEVDAAAWWARASVLGLACAAVVLSRAEPENAAIAGAALLLGHFISYQHVWEHHYSAVLLVGLLVLRAAHSQRREMATWLAAGCLVLIAAPTPFYFWDVHHDPRVWDPAGQWPAARAAALASFKSAPALVLYVLALRLCVLEGRGGLMPRALRADAEVASA